MDVALRFLYNTNACRDTETYFPKDLATTFTSKYDICGLKSNVVKTRAKLKPIASGHEANVPTT